VIADIDKIPAVDTEIGIEPEAEHNDLAIFQLTPTTLPLKARTLNSPQTQHKSLGNQSYKSHQPYW
jgi:hypothetical protein